MYCLIVGRHRNICTALIIYIYIYKQQRWLSHQLKALNYHKPCFNLISEPIYLNRFILQMAAPLLLLCNKIVSSVYYLLLLLHQLIILQMTAPLIIFYYYCFKQNPSATILLLCNADFLPHDQRVNYLLHCAIVSAVNYCIVVAMSWSHKLITLA